jgi:iron complex transport system substrate-binding protein
MATASRRRPNYPHTTDIRRIRMLSNLRRVASTVALIALSFAGLPGMAGPVAQADSRTFPETGKTVSGKFLAYWNAHGGLAQIGYPLSNEMQDVSETDGKTYTTQYFERAVLEMHPENAGSQFEVQGGLIGVFAYHDRYPMLGGAPGQKASATNPRLFPETGKTLGGAFRAYWESHGGLAQQGLPISDEFQEKSALNGQTYTVQYFERAVFELHPENKAPYDVLLSQLGTFQSRAKADLSFTDSTGTKVTLAARPQRIVCLFSMCEDILFELGLEPAAASDKFYQLPEFWGPSKSLPAISGGFATPNLEDIAKIKPDLVIGFVPHTGLRDALKPIAPLFIMNPAQYPDTIRDLKTMGRLTDRAFQAEKSTNAFLTKLAAYKAKSPNTKTPLILFGRNTNFSIFTSGSLFGSVLAAATKYPWAPPGAGDVGAPDQEPGSLQYSLEKVLEKDPDVLLVETQGGGTPTLSQQLAASPVWSELKAVKDKQVYDVRFDLYVGGRGTRSLGLALDDAMKKIYPETFPNPLP